VRQPDRTISYTFCVARQHSRAKIKVLMAKNYVDNLSEEVKKGLREKAEQGHWPTVAPVGYVNNRVTHRIEVDPVRGPLVARVFELYATGNYSLKAITQLAYHTGLRHPRADRRMTKFEIHRMLQRLVYTGAFMWMGKRYVGSHEPLIVQETFDEVQAVLRRKPRARYPKQRHAFMGLLTCGRCGCSITAEKKRANTCTTAVPGTKARAGTATSARSA